MIKAKQLKKLLEEIPDEADVWAYVGGAAASDNHGIAVEHAGQGWFIEADEEGDILDPDWLNTYTEGFLLEQ